MPCNIGGQTKTVPADSDCTTYWRLSSGMDGVHVGAFINLLTFSVTHPDVGPFFWEQRFFRNLVPQDRGWPEGWQWVMLKNQRAASEPV